MPYRWASSLLCNEVCVRFSAHKPFVNQTQYVWAIMSTCSLRAFFRFLTGGAEFTLTVSLKFNFCFHLKRGTEIFHSKQFLKWNQRSDNSGGNMQWDYRMWTEVGYIQWLFIHNKYLNALKLQINATDVLQPEEIHKGVKYSTHSWANTKKK